MSNRSLSISWGALYVLCGGLGFIPSPEGFARLLLTLLSLAFFIPPALLLWRGIVKRQRKVLLHLRNLSLVWLGLTLLLLILNILSVAMPMQAGNFLHALLTLLCAPLICSQYWLLPMFLWACLLITSWQQLRKPG